MNMADWFKFHNDGLDSGQLQYCISEQPLVVSVWILILSEASKKRSAKIPWDASDFMLLGHSRKLNISPPIFNQCLGLLEHCKFIIIKDGELEITVWEKVQSDYAKGMDRGYFKKKSPATSDVLTSDSLVSTARGEESRREEKREEVRTHPAHGFPLSEEDAVKLIPLGAGYPEQFVKDSYHKANSRGGLDSKGIPIVSFVSYVASEWKYERQRRESDRQSNNSGHYAAPKKSIAEQDVEALARKLNRDYENHTGDVQILQGKHKLEFR